MAYVYRPRGLPRFYLEMAPEIIRAQVLGIFGPFKDAVCEYEILLRPAPGDSEIIGLDFGADGSRGCHFFLKPYEARTYRDRNRRKRVVWHQGLPEPTRKAILAYLSE